MDETWKVVIAPVVLLLVAGITIPVAVIAIICWKKVMHDKGPIPVQNIAQVILVHGN